MIGTAIGANQAWLDRHFLPSFFIPRHWYCAIETAARLLVAAAGAVLIAARVRITNVLARAPRVAAHAAIAAILAVVASEAVLRRIHPRPTEWLVSGEEPRRQDDAVLGWVLVPSHLGRSRIGGRVVEYATDLQGYRVQRLDLPVDPTQPTIVFGGESVMFGEGLTWEESIPAQVGAMLGIQTANLAVHGYSTDQTYLRLTHELPRFRRPVAVVCIFMTELFGRNLDDDRPHLASGLVWKPAERASRLRSLAAMLVPYRRETTIEQGVQTTREILHAIVDLARARGATPLIVVPQFGPDDALQGAIRARALSADLPQLLVSLDPGWRLPWDRHPNADAAHLIARAIVTRLGRR